MAPTTDTLVSPERYLNKSYESDMEYANGLLIGRNVGNQLHSALQVATSAYFHRYSEEFRIRGFTGCRLQRNAVTGRHCIPDVMIVERPYARGKAVTDVPAVVIEIKSPDDRFDEILEKCMEYEALGVPNIVVLDPDFRRSYLFANSALQLVRSHVHLHFPKSNLSLSLPTDILFAETDDAE